MNTRNEPDVCQCRCGHSLSQSFDHGGSSRASQGVHDENTRPERENTRLCERGLALLFASAGQRRPLQVEEQQCVHSLFAKARFGCQARGVGAETIFSQSPVLAALVLHRHRTHWVCVRTHTYTHQERRDRKQSMKAEAPDRNSGHRRRCRGRRPLFLNRSTYWFCASRLEIAETNQQIIKQKKTWIQTFIKPSAGWEGCDEDASVRQTPCYAVVCNM